MSTLLVVGPFTYQISFLMTNIYVIVLLSSIFYTSGTHKTNIKNPLTPSVFNNKHFYWSISSIDIVRVTMCVPNYTHVVYICIYTYTMILISVLNAQYRNYSKINTLTRNRYNPRSSTMLVSRWIPRSHHPYDCHFNLRA